MTTGGYWYHGERRQPQHAVNDQPYQDRLLQALAEETATNLRTPLITAPSGSRSPIGALLDNHFRRHGHHRALLRQSAVPRAAGGSPSEIHHHIVLWR